MKKMSAAILTAAVLAGLAMTTAPAQAASHCTGGGGAIYICEYGVTTHPLPNGAKQEFVIGTDNAVWTRWTDTRKKWSGWVSLGGILSGPIYVIDRWSDGDPWRFALSVHAPDGYQWVNQRDHNGNWGGWIRMPDPDS